MVGWSRFDRIRWLAKAVFKLSAKLFCQVSIERVRTLAQKQRKQQKKKSEQVKQKIKKKRQKKEKLN